jgi:predicted metal-binding protein
MTWYSNLCSGCFGSCLKLWNSSPENLESNQMSDAVVNFCKIGACGSQIQTTSLGNELIEVTGNGIMLGSCTLECDTGINIYFEILSIVSINDYSLFTM